MDSVIVSAVRTPTGKFLGALKEFSAPQLGALVVREAVRRAGIDPASSRNASWATSSRRASARRRRARRRSRGGLADHVAALTINKVCGSGLKAVMLAAQGIATGDIEIAVAGGMESMSNAPYLLPRAREGLRMGHGQVHRLDDQRRPVVLVRADATWATPAKSSRPSTASARGSRTRTRSRAIARRPTATAAGRVRRRRSCRSRSRRRRAIRSSSTRDESIRADTTLEALGALAAGVREGRHGDGRQRAAGQRRRRRARRHVGGARAAARRDADGAHRRAGDERPGPEVRADDAGRSRAHGRSRRSAGSWHDVDLFEINEAFSVQAARRAAASSASIRRRSTSTAAPWRSVIRSAPAARAS